MFVRELLQNARDAGATRVEFRVARRQEGGRSVVSLTCADDGSGMSFDHAKRFLFRLYASSKESQGDQVGRFGVGFWSILRFSPTRIEIRSCTGARDSAWAIELSGDLSSAREWTPVMPRGSEIVLEREIDDGAPADRAGDDREIRRRLEDAVWQNGRFLRRRDDPRAPLDVLVDGKLIRAEFSLPPPATRFASGPMRGVVGLGSAPGVELFSRGLRVRVAAALDDLRTDDANTRRSRVRFVEMPEAMAPRVLLEDDGLELLLNRSEARDGRRLDRLVTLANEALETLVEQQIALAQPPTLGERLAATSRRLLGDSVALRILASASVGAVVGLAIVASGVIPLLVDTEAGGPRSSEVVPVGVPERGPYRDLAARYDGPSVTELASPATASSADVELRYTPTDARPYLAALRVTLDPWGRPRSTGGAAAKPRTLVQVDPCDTNRPEARDAPPDMAECMGFAIHVGASDTPIRLPIPSGHALVQDSLRVNDVVATPGVATDGLPTVQVSMANGALVTYETGRLRPTPRSRDADLDTFDVDGGISLPPALRREMKALRRTPMERRVSRATSRVRELVRYSTERHVAAAHRAALRDRTQLVDRALRIGAGDCDVQGALLVAMLAEADVPARLVVGFVGRDGRANPWLHAWVEWRDEVGRIHVADPAQRTTPGSHADVGADESSAEVDAFDGSGPDDGSREGSRVANRETAGAPDGPAPSGDPPDGNDGVDTTGAAPRDFVDPTVDDRARAAGVGAYRAALGYVALAAESAAGARAFDRIGLNLGATRTPTTSSADAGSTNPFDALQRWARWALFATMTALALFGAALWWRRRRTEEVELAAPEALTKLLLGALSQPGAFQHVPALFDRRLVPCLAGRSLSLREARTLAREGALVHSAAHGPLSLRAARRGTPVVDASHPSGRVVASSLAGLDLDRWERRLQHGDRTPLTMACERALASAGLTWRIVVAHETSAARGGSERITALDLVSIGLSPRGPLRASQDVRIVAIDPSDAVFLAISERFSRELAGDPSIAPLCVFGLVDHLLGAIAAPDEVRARVLEPLARAVARARPLVPPAQDPAADRSGGPGGTR